MNQFKPGDVVSFQGRVRAEDEKTPMVGTVFILHQGDALILDGQGHIFTSKISEIYLAQGEVYGPDF